MCNPKNILVYILASGDTNIEVYFTNFDFEITKYYAYIAAGSFNERDWYQKVFISTLYQKDSQSHTQQTWRDETYGKTPKFLIARWMTFNQQFGQLQR